MFDCSQMNSLGFNWVLFFGVGVAGNAVIAGHGFSTTPLGKFTIIQL